MKNEKRMFWRGAQWAVTDYGLECIDGVHDYYVIHRDQLLPSFEWPEHMAEKNWVITDDFNRAYQNAIQIFAKGQQQ